MPAKSRSVSAAAGVVDAPVESEVGIVCSFVKLGALVLANPVETLY